MKDKFGQDIEVGSYLAYAVRRGNLPYLQIGIVTKIAERKVGVRSVHDRWRGLVLSEKDGVLTDLSRAIVLKDVAPKYRELLDVVPITL